MSADNAYPTYGYTDEELVGLPTVYADRLFAGQVVLVSGAGGGLGKAIAVLYARLGANLAICGRNKEKLDKTELLLRRLGAEVSVHPMTIRDPAQVSTLMDAVFDRYGRLDVLVNNAGGQFAALALDFTPGRWGGRDRHQPQRLVVHDAGGCKNAGSNATQPAASSTSCRRFGAAVRQRRTVAQPAPA